ncbi:magnesium transporter CorA family protein, partial [Clostridium saudiense]|nr:magnesium transporter CorA family protein [Clostridium saudiense]
LSETNPHLKALNNIEPGCWINMVAPTEEEIILVSKKTGVPLNFLRAPLDDEETSRIEFEDGYLLVIVDIPFTEMEDNSLTYDTYPLAIIHSEKQIVTVCLKNSRILTDFINNKVKSFFSFKKSRFILQILNRVSTYYLIYLRQIDKKSLMIEKRLHKSMKNRELIQLHSLEKSLVYFSTSLKANEITLEKMLKLEIMQKYPEDQDVLEDVIIENKQAIEMTDIYS